MPYPTAATVTLPSPQPGSVPDIPALCAYIQANLTLTIAQDSTLLGQGTVLPTSDVGPFIYTGVNPPQLYTWNSVKSKYVPSAASPIDAVTFDELDAMFASQTAGGKQQTDWTNVVNKPALFADTMVGTTAQRSALVSPQSYNLWWDTNLQCLLIYYGGTWHTVDGCPGDVKYVSAADIAAALAQNPGWTQNAAATARFIVSSGDGSGSGLSTYANGDTGGAETVTLDMTKLPALIGLTGIGLNSGIPYASAGAQGPPYVNAGTTNFTNTGGGQATAIRNPFVAYWCLIKT